MFALRKALVIFFCVCGSNLLAEAPLRVWVGIPPLAELVRALGGEQVSVQLLVGRGQSHETFSPTARQMRTLANADVYFAMGLPFENVLLQRIGNAMPHLQVVDTVATVPLLDLASEHGCSNCHAHDHNDHSHHVDVHRWLSPPILIAQTKAVVASLSRLRPQSAAAFETHAAAFIADVEELDKALQSQLAPHRNSAFMINHPALGYFADHFGLRQIAIESEGLQPSPARIRELSRQANEQSVRWVIIQAGQPRTAAAVLARSLELPVIEVDPFNPDALGEMRALTKALVSLPTP
jgi:zinc transport system substrate-binding protein